MADTFSGFLKIRLPQTGAYNNTWGAVLNSDALNFLDKSITGQAGIALSGLTYSLAALGNGTDSESRAFCLQFTGVPGGAVTVTVPTTVIKKFYLVDNQCGQQITFTYSGSTSTVVVPVATKQLIWCDGTNCFAVTAAAANATSLGGIDAQYWARTGRTATEIAAPTYLLNNFVNGVRNASPWSTVTESPTTTIDTRQGNQQILTLTGNRTMAAPSNVTDGQAIILYVLQDGTGGRTLTWNAVFQFDQGAAPVLTTTAAHGDLFLMIYNSALAVWLVSHLGQNTGAAGGANYNLTIAENTVDWNLLARLGAPGGAVSVNVTINPGIVVQALSTGMPALDLSGLPSGSTVNLFNSGYVLGAGGEGGAGLVHSDFGAPSTNGPYDGLSAGNAILGPGSGRTFNVTNANGHIWGGGGGGGGGGASYPASANFTSGGGGGGGAGGGKGGRGGRVGFSAANNFNASDGLSGSTGISGSFGAGGNGGSSGGSASAGGAGGDWGTVGTAGSTNTTFGTGNLQSLGGAGGAAGLAISLAGGAVTWISGSGSPNVRGLTS